MERRARLGDRTAKTRAGVDRQLRHWGRPPTCARSCTTANAAHATVRSRSAHSAALAPRRVSQQRAAPRLRGRRSPRKRKENTMRVFLAGASGAIGTRLVPQLIDAGHDVIGSHTSPSSGERVRALGAKPVALDLLDARAVRKAVREANPDAIVHQATALANVKFSRNMDKV